MSFICSEKFAEERKNREYWENRCSQMTQAMSEKESELRNSELTRTEYEHKLAHMQSELERERAALNALRERLEDINRQSEMVSPAWYC